MLAPSRRALLRWPSVVRVEPVLPTALGLHGLLITALQPGQAWPAWLFGGVCVIGLAGMLGWRSSTARAVRSVVCLVTPLTLSIAEPSLVPALLQWYYCAAAVYSLTLSHRAAVLLGPLAGSCYLLQIAAGAAPVPWTVAYLRAAVLLVLGLSMRSAGVAYRVAQREAELGRVAAEAARSEVQHLATHDGLTGLPNRSLLHDRISDARTAGRRATLLLLDLDRFKEVNDSLGHAYGDRMLVNVGSRLQEIVRVDDTVARLGGDEFAVLLLDADEGVAARTATRVRQALQEPFLLDGALVAVDASIGIATTTCSSVSPDELLQHADVAMYAAKRSGEGSAFYDPASAVQSRDGLALLAELRLGLAAGDLFLEYQPQVAAGGGRVVGVEALVRWQHPARGRLMPDAFVPLAERSGLISKITAFVLDLALSQCREWRADGLDLCVSVNLSARDLAQDDLAEQVRCALRRHGLPPGALTLEITESFLMADPRRARNVLIQLFELGVTLAIDDFGTGLASLSYLKNLPVQVLKIDRSFITHMLGDSTDDAIVRGVVALSSSLGLVTVAEGVEDAATLDRLREIGCTHAQGYGISRPMPPGHVAPWVRARLASATS